MRKEYDFSAARKNPYAAQLKKQITIRLDEDSITYFKAISVPAGLRGFQSETQSQLEIKIPKQAMARP